MGGILKIEFLIHRLILVIIALISHTSLACDVCLNTFETVPNERKSSFGIYYSTVYRNGYPMTQTKHSGHLNFVGSEVKEIFNVYDVRYRHAFSDRIFGDFVLPLRNNYLGINRSQLFDRWGLGDIQLQFTYRLVKPEVENKVNHRLDLAFGGDLPSGSWTDSINQIILDPVYQFGSGSFDYWSSFSYVCRIGIWGAMVNGLYRKNTTNPLHYKFGDAINGDFSMFFLLNFNKFKIMPRTGVFYEQGFSAKNRGLYDLHSGEQMVSTQHGFSIFFDKWQFNGTIRNVLFHKTNGVEVRQRYFGQFSLVYNF